MMFQWASHATDDANTNKNRRINLQEMGGSGSSWGLRCSPMRLISISSVVMETTKWAHSIWREPVPGILELHKRVAGGVLVFVGVFSQERGLKKQVQNYDSQFSSLSNPRRFSFSQLGSHHHLSHEPTALFPFYFNTYSTGPRYASVSPWTLKQI